MASQTHAHLSTFEALDRFLGSKNDRKIKNNTRAIRHDADTIAVRLHATDVLTFTRTEEDVMTVDGYQRVTAETIVLDSGGYQTTTTKARMNEFLPRRFGVIQDDFAWYVIDRNQADPWSKANRLPFEDLTELTL